MTIDVAEYERLKAKADEAQRTADRASGALDTMMQKLDQEFGCKTLAEGEAMAADLDAKAVAAAALYSTALADFKAKWENGPAKPEAVAVAKPVKPKATDGWDDDE